MTRPLNACRTGSRHRAGGVSLIEALLALVVMSLGMLAVVGVQATLRANGDLSRQRAEAVRLAQEAIEEWRTFTSVTAVAGQQDYTDIASDSHSTDVTPAGANTTYNRTRLVAAAPANGSPPMSTFSVTVQWVDRTGEDQLVQLFSSVARVAPALSASLSVPPNGRPARQPLGRHVAIPRGAVTNSDGTSTFTPPQPAEAPTTTLVFNNLSGEIVCIKVNGGPCGTDRGQLLTGVVELPAVDTAFAMRVDYRSSAGAAESSGSTLDPTRSELWDRTENCFMDTPQGNVASYFCVVRLPVASTEPTPTWSGQVVFGPGAAFVSAPRQGPLSPSVLRACRYATVPSSYANVSRPLSNQNFLLVTATSACPAPATTPHQPP